METTQDTMESHKVNFGLSRKSNALNSFSCVDFFTVLTPFLPVVLTSGLCYNE